MNPNDTLLFIAFLLGAIILLIGYFLGLMYGDILQRKEKEEFKRTRTIPTIQAKKISLPQKQTEQTKSNTPRPKREKYIELGAVPQPTAEELEMRNKPLQKAEEEAWDETIEIIAKTQNRNNGIGGIQIKE